MDVKIYPKKLSGSIFPPSSKSLSHRSIICASMAGGRSVIDNIYISDDIRATIDAMKSLGAGIEIFEDKLTIDGIDLKDKISSKYSYGNIEIDCNESGSTIRFILPILSLLNGNFKVKSRGNLSKRPMDIYFEIFDREGITYNQKEDEICIEGGKGIKNNLFEIRGDISSQFISGLLFILPLLEFDSEIRILGNFESESYVDLTISVLEKFCVYVDKKSENSIYIKGNQSYSSAKYKVETDYSQAAFFVVAKAIGNDICINNLSKESLQGDRVILDIVDKMIVASEDLEKELLQIDGSDIPDIVPILSLAASKMNLKTRINNVGRLKIKESDRLEATFNELSEFGIDIEILSEDGLYNLEIRGSKDNVLKGGKLLSSHKDHRIAMMLAIASTICDEPIVIKDAEYVSKSFPDFWEKFVMLGGEIDVCNMGK